MVDDDGHAGVTRRDLGDQSEEVWGLGAHVEGEASFTEQVECLVDGRIPEEVRVGVAVHQMPNADDRLVSPAIEQRVGRTRIAQRHPRDNPSHPFMEVCRAQHVLGVVDVVGRLDQHDLAHTERGLLGPELVELEGSGQLWQLVEPRVLSPLRVPDMDMAVDHGHLAADPQRRELDATRSEDVVEARHRRLQVPSHRVGGRVGVAHGDRVGNLDVLRLRRGRLSCVVVQAIHVEVAPKPRQRVTEPSVAAQLGDAVSGRSRRRSCRAGSP